MQDLKPSQIEAAFLLSRGKSKKTVANNVGVHANTISNWCKLTAFEALINELQHERLERAQDLLRSSTVPAAKLLLSVVNDNSVDIKSRITAARLILDYVGIGCSEGGLTYCGPDDVDEIEKKKRLQERPLLKLLPDHLQ